MNTDLKQKVLDFTKGGRITRVLRNRDFIYLWIGQGISLLGDQFYLIALPWLVLLMTNDPIAVGTVLGTAGIPRIIFMLIGGALTDRYSPRKIMLVSTILRTIIVGILTTLILTDSVQIWMLYVMALGFGIADAFFYPAQGAIIPSIVDSEDLPAGNGITFGTQQVMMIIGPVLAGLTISLLSDPIKATELSSLSLETIENVKLNLSGVGIALLIDTISFMGAIVALLKIRHDKKIMEEDNNEDIFRSIRSSFKYIWSDKPMRMIFIIVGAVQFFITGPLTIAIPVVSKTILPEGAAAYGMIMSSLGLGALIGVVIASIFPQITGRHIKTMLSAVAGISGAGLLLLGFITVTPLCILVTFIIGLLGGYVVIFLYTWVQKRSPRHQLGRIMALLSIVSLGLQAVAQSIAGIVIDWSLLGLFVITGSVMFCVMFLANFSPDLKEL